MLSVACMAFQQIVLDDVIQILASITEHAMNAMMDILVIVGGVHLKDQYVLMVRKYFLKEISSEFQYFRSTYFSFFRNRNWCEFAIEFGIEI